jgi:glycerol-3-phosphate acyltransferase PlsY
MSGSVIILLPAVAYLLGAVPFGLILCRTIKGVDIREHGSRNIGATNAGRVCGWPFFFLTFGLDFAKGAVPTFVFAWAAARGVGPWKPIEGTMAPSMMFDLVGVFCGIGAILGHTFPVYVRFRGGKAVATSFGVFVALAPVAALIALGVWAVVFLAFRYVSLASMTAAVTAPVAYTVQHRAELGRRLPVLGFAAAVALLVVVRHRANIGRLLRGEESRVGGKKPDTG